MGGPVTTLTIETNIGMFPNYTDQAVIVDGLTPFTEYLVSVIPVMGQSTLTRVDIYRTTLEAGSIQHIHFSSEKYTNV